RRVTNIGKHILVEFNEKVLNLYNSEKVPILESIHYSVKKYTFNINYEDEDKAKKK
ncbi:15422_t:CDS:1, partial [Funneliformis caledonium]